MKDLLNYYYYIYPDKIQMFINNYYFSFKNYNYIFYLYNGNLEELNNIFNLNKYMLFNNYKTNEIILNKDLSIVTKKDNKYYILIKLIIDNNSLITLNNIIEFTKIRININNLLNRTNWSYLWQNKIDNIEYILNHIKHKYKLLYNSCFYYIGMSENAISYLNYFNLNNNNISISHKRINIKENLKDFYNPLNMIIDYKVRDLAEYYKSLFFMKNLDIKEILNSFELINMSNIDYIYFYIRMLYPSYYFDLFDNILNKTVNEKNILTITSNQNDYEYFLYLIYLIIKKRINIIGIEWINKKFINR